MTEITRDHVEWAVVQRLRLMLEEEPHQTFNVTQAYALFTSILCWAMQRIRIKSHEIKTRDDKIAHNLLTRLDKIPIGDDPWRVHVSPAPHIEVVGSARIVAPEPQGFRDHTVGRFLINLRDATAHGDARIVSPFNIGTLLAGFTFDCAEFEGSGKSRKEIWRGKITLLESDIRRIGIQLATSYCDEIRQRERYSAPSSFGAKAASIQETAA